MSESMRIHPNAPMTFSRRGGVYRHLLIRDWFDLCKKRCSLIQKIRTFNSADPDYL